MVQVLGSPALHQIGQHFKLRPGSRQMRSETTGSKWGNSLAVRSPLTIAKQAGISEEIASRWF